AGLDGGDAERAGARVGDGVRRDDLLAERHRPRGGLDRGRGDVAGQPGFVVGEQDAVLAPIPAYRVQAAGELAGAGLLAPGPPPASTLKPVVVSTPMFWQFCP